MINPITDTVVVSQALEAMREVYDPELGIDVVALGLIYDIDVDDRQITISMTLTTPGCPVSEQLPAEVAHAVTSAFPDAQVDVEIVWEPPWTPDRMSGETLAGLGAPAHVTETALGVPRSHSASALWSV